MRRGRHGFVLPAMLLLLLTLTAVAHGVLAFAASELRIGKVSGEVLAAELAAQAVIVRAVQLDTSFPADLALFGAEEVAAMSLGHATGRARVVRLTSESWVVEGEGVSDSGMTVRDRSLVWTLDPLARIGALGSPLTHGEGAVNELVGPIVLDSLESGPQCSGLGESVGSSVGAGSPTAAAALQAGAGPVGLGLLSSEDALARITAPVSGTGTPGPIVDGNVCVDTGWNWGAPRDSLSPCNGRLSMRSASADLTISGGTGFVFLFVDGDLTVNEGAALEGMLVVTGRLKLIGGSTLHGFAVAGSGAHVDGSSRLVGSVCAAVQALERSRRALGAAVQVESAARLGPY